MNIRTRTRNALFAAVVTGAVSTVLATPGTAQAEFGLANKQASVGEMHSNVVAAMNGKAFGWQLAIAQNGQIKVKDSDGTAVSKMDGGLTTWVDMQPTFKMELASVTKNITAVATMKLLRRNYLNVESLVWPYLPKGWTIPESFKKVKFRHLLTHTSGINQAISAMPEDERPKDNSWDSMKIVVENGTKVDSQRQYKNANYALLRILNAQLWYGSGGKMALNGAAFPVAAWNHTVYGLDFMRKHIFEPAGLEDIGCNPSFVRSYPKNASQYSSGTKFSTGLDECAGARGIAMSSVELVQYLAHLRHGSIIHPDDLETMDQLRAGWDEDSNGGDGGQFGTLNGIPDNPLSPGAYWHGGDLSTGQDVGADELHTCAMTFDDGTEATLLVNSGMTSGSPCGVLLAAWYAAK